MGDVTRIQAKARVAAILSRMKKTGDGEYQIVLNRLSIILVLSLYVLGLWLTGYCSPAHAVFLGGLCSAYFVVAFLFAVTLFRNPHPSYLRRSLQIAWDIGFLSLTMGLGGEQTAPLYPIYLWVILGYGFRFGLGYLVAGSMLGASGFALAEIWQPVWRGMGYLLTGLVLGLLIIPLYSASLIRFLSETRRRAEESSRAKTRFVASVSHELRTPLNAILGLGAILLSEDMNAEQREMVNTIHGAGSTLLSMINELLDFARLEEGRMPVRSHPFALMSAVRNVMNVVQVEASRKGIGMSCELAARVPVNVEGDRHHLEEILRNIIGNAVKFTERGLVSLFLDATCDEAGAVCLSVKVVDTGIGIAEGAREHVFESFTQADGSVLDRFGGTGLGLSICRSLVELHGGQISLESTPEKGSIFHFTYQLKTDGYGETADSTKLVFITRDPVMEKTLLPLLVASGRKVTVAGTVSEGCRQLSLCNGYAVLVTDPSSHDVVSAINAAFHTSVPRLLPHLAFVGEKDFAHKAFRDPAGLVFADLPLTAEARTVRNALNLLSGLLPDEVVPVARSAAGRALAPRSCKVLVAEDNAVNRMVLTKVLDRAGHSWVEVSNGEEALDVLEREHFDVVLMDINMPLMNGIEATKIRRFAEMGGTRTPIVALTADASQEARTRCREAGVDGFLLKPVDMNALLEMLRRYAPADKGEEPVEEESPVVKSADTMPEVGVVVEFPGAAVNRKAIQALDELGGRTFRADVVREFLREAERTVQRIRDAFDREDAALPDEVHALQSAAANVGAERLSKLCREWRKSRNESGGSGTPDQIRTVEEEMRRVRDGLLPYVDETLELT